MIKKGVNNVKILIYVGINLMIVVVGGVVVDKISPILSIDLKGSLDIILNACLLLTLVLVFVLFLRLNALKEKLEAQEKKTDNLFIENLIQEEAINILNTRKEKSVKEIANSVALKASRKLNKSVPNIDEILKRYFPNK